MPSWSVLWYGPDEHRHVEVIPAATKLDAVAFALRRHPNARHVRVI